MVEMTHETVKGSSSIKLTQICKENQGGNVLQI